MEVYRVEPHGYCQGVEKAMRLALEEKKRHPDAEVYLLGMLVHNEEAIQELLEAGLMFIDERRVELSAAIQGIPEGSTLIFSAHGHPKSWEKIAADRHLKIVDATCPFVNFNLIAAKKCDAPLIYLGVAGHLEAEAFRANVPSAYFFDVATMRFDRAISSNGYPNIIAQTTLSQEEIAEALHRIHQDFPEAKLLKGTCLSTTERQESIKRLPEDVDVLIVLGSSSSNNSKKLAEIGAKRGLDTHLVLGLDELKRIRFDGKKKVALSSGASTSPKTYDLCCDYLLSL